MIIILKDKVEEASILKLQEYISAKGLKTTNIVGSNTTVMGLIGDTAVIEIDSLKMFDVVDKVIKVQEPYKRANRRFHTQDTVIDINGVKIGGGSFTVIAGPCSVETPEQINEVAERVKASGAKILRGGAFKPRTSPYSFQGLKAEGLELLEGAKKNHGLPIISEITSVRQIDLFVDKVDIIQVGARNMQNFELLKELGSLKIPVLIKRGFSCTIEELLMSAEYVMSAGNENIILCERGIRTFEHYTRNTLDISAIPVLKRLSHLPVFVDPSHASGINWLVEPLALAAAAAGADGVMVEVHNCPSCALCDGAQSLNCDEFDALMKKTKVISNAVGKYL